MATVLHLILLFLFHTSTVVGQDLKEGLEQKSDFSRAVASQAVRFTQPTDPIMKRKTFPEQEPHICLAFLSCCGRTDLLNHTLAGAIRHMEEDEPSHLRYEIAWVDNGSGPDLTSVIEDSYEIDHALPMPQNMGLAYGMNLLIFNLCQAPYILLLEEDWLYLDDIVVPQTERRKRVIATSIGLIEQNIKSFDGRNVMGVFLRPETYNSFLRFPLADVWEEAMVDLNKLPGDDQCGSDSSNNVKVDYQIFCSDPAIQTGNIWGSYTNGVGLYRREYLHEVGRMYGEPGDAFHDRYVEGNYAYRVGLKNCHAALQLGDCRELGNPVCTAAFYHIGGGRGTRPQKASNSMCAHEMWNFWGTPMFSKFSKVMGGVKLCSKEEIQKLRGLKLKEKDSAQYREEVRQRNKEVFKKEREERDNMILQANRIRETNNDVLRRSVDWMADMSDEEIAERANHMERLANSPHPLDGFWDMLGRPLK